MTPTDGGAPASSSGSPPGAEGGGRGVPRAVADLLRTEAAGGVVLLAATVAAVAWANSPWRAAYGSLLHTGVRLGVGGLTVRRDLVGFVNEALMAVFFFLVGLEVKRELVAGELRSWRTAALPAIAAVGGMALPAAIYEALTRGGPGAPGWGVPIATDVAFAVGVMAVLGPRVPSSLRLFLLTLATVDDLVAIVIIAVGYSSGISLAALAMAAALVAAIVALRILGARWAPVYVVAGVGVWAAVLRSGVHPTLAGALLGLLVPARPPRRSAPAATESPPGASSSTAERVEHRLRPVVSLAVVPLFALANAGVAVGGGLLHGPGATRLVVAGVVARVGGKVVGILAFAWMAVRVGLGALPAGVSWRQMAGAAATAGVGLTVAVFLADLALPPALAGAAVAATLAASVVAAVAGAAVLIWAARKPNEP
ncbi:MAG: Na+/H+ antiporter NhaA [Acidimicrobiales bacterium]